MKSSRYYVWACALGIGLLGSARGAEEEPLRLAGAPRPAALSTPLAAAAVSMHIMLSGERSIFYAGFQ